MGIVNLVNAGLFDFVPCVFTYVSPLAWHQRMRAKRKRPDATAHQPERWQTHCGGHPSDLTILAFDEGDHQPAGGNLRPCTNRGLALPKPVWRFDARCAAAKGGEITQIQWRL